MGMSNHRHRRRTYKYAGIAQVLRFVNDAMLINDMIPRYNFGQTYMISTTSTMISESLTPREKKAGPADPVLNARMLKFAENQTKNIWLSR